jgi:predicted TPR repeat methyltransferase
VVNGNAGATAIEQRSTDDANDTEGAELSVSEALGLAVQCHQEGNLDAAAERIYGAVLELLPDQPDALHFLGVLLHQRGNSSRGAELIRRAISHAPASPGLYNNLGNVLYEDEQFEEAALAYERATELQPNAGTYNNLGVTRRVQGRFEDSEAAYQRAIELDPKHADAHNNFGNLLGSRGRIREALDHFCTAMTLLPNHPEARRQLGVAYSALGRKQEAAEVYRNWLIDEPDNAVAAHMLAACSGEGTPERASDRFVERVFDNFARSFDIKLAKLEYRAPELVRDALARVTTPTKSLITLDAGCGTGLCGALIEEYVSQLTGVDLSGQMLIKAKGRKLYAELIRAELGEYLAAQNDRFDLIVSADTLVYFGALEPVLAAAANALKKPGLLIFSVERADDTLAAQTGHLLNPNGRYSHSQPYLKRALDQAGFSSVTFAPGILRREAGLPVEGLIVTARRAD